MICISFTYVYIHIYIYMHLYICKRFGVKQHHKDAAQAALEKWSLVSLRIRLQYKLELASSSKVLQSLDASYDTY